MAFFRKSFTKILKIPRNCRYSIKLRDMHNTIFTEKVVGAHIYERCLRGAGADTDINLNMQTDNINAGLGYCFERFGRYFIDDGFDVEVVGIFLVKEQIPTEYLANNTKDFDGTMEYDGEEHNLIYGGIRLYLATNDEECRLYCLCWKNYGAEKVSGFNCETKSIVIEAIKGNFIDPDDSAKLLGCRIMSQRLLADFCQLL